MQLSQAGDFLTESEALYALLEPVDPTSFDEPTQFKDWTINQVLRHLHFWNLAADLSLQDEAAFMQLIKEVMTGKKSLREFEEAWLKGLSGAELLEQWRVDFVDIAARFGKTDPKLRLKWAGPDMSAKSSITARLMETWAHGQEVYDHLGAERQNGDHIHNIAYLGINTFGWTHKVNRLEIPEKLPYVRLTAPSGAIWEWGEVSEEDYVKGDATEFCQVVTQVRNIADTSIETRGDVATNWMTIAQCFAGGKETPPPPGTRFRRPK